MAVVPPRRRSSSLVLVLSLFLTDAALAAPTLDVWPTSLFHDQDTPVRITISATGPRISNVRRQWSAAARSIPGSKTAAMSSATPTGAAGSSDSRKDRAVVASPSTCLQWGRSSSRKPRSRRIVAAPASSPSSASRPGPSQVIGFPLPKRSSSSVPDQASRFVQPSGTPPSHVATSN